VNILAQRWQRYWFRPVSVRRLAALRFVLLTPVILDLVFDPNGIRAFGERTSEAFWNPNELVIVRLLDLPRTPTELWMPLWAVLIVCAVLAFVGLYTRIALWILAFGYAWWYIAFFSHGSVGHGRLILVVALFALAIAPSGRAYSLDALIARARRARTGEPLPAPQDESDPLAGWAIRFVGITVVLTYLSAAWTKILTGGLDWPFAGALDAALIEQGTRLGKYFADYPNLVHLLAVGALVLEATAWMLLLGGRARDLWAVSAVMFHLGSLVLLSVNFMDYPFAYAAFYPLEVATAWLGLRARNWSADRHSKVELEYDGMCGLCVRTVTFLGGLDWLGRLRLVDGTSADGTRLQVFTARDADDRHDGFFAYRRIARALPALWPVLPLLYLPGLSHLGQKVYEHVAANRGSSCSITACAIPEGASAARPSFAPASSEPTAGSGS
jgi:predicted DCC family thiol-disulfide oxidoreductase YuxK